MKWNEIDKTDCKGHLGDCSMNVCDYKEIH